MSTFAETVFLNANVITVDEEFSIAEAVAVAGGRILAVGTAVDVSALIGPATEINDLGGRTLLPGFVEAHGHPTAEMNFLGPACIDIRAVVCGSAEEVMGKLQAAVAGAGPGDWVVAFGWDPLLLPDLPAMSGQLLTELSPSVPLSVMHYSAHSSWANDAALARLGVTADTPDPAGSEYCRNKDGSLTGEGKELPASMILMGPAMEVNDKTFNPYLARQLERMAAAGVTSTGDLAFHPGSHGPVRSFYESVEAPVRIRAYEMSTPAGPARTAGTDDDSMFRQVGAKVWTDGSPWIGNIETSFGYEDSRATRAIGLEPGHRGCSNYTRDELLAIGRQYVPAGWQLACHVHGDLAVEMVLDVVAQLQAEFPGADRRFRLEHCGTITPGQVGRAHALGITISFFAAHIHYYGDVLVDLFGARANSWTPVGAAADCGMKFSLHNDAPVTPESPLLNIQVAMTRLTRSGVQLGPEFRIGIEDAIRSHTIHAAWQLFSEHEFGSIEAGKFADFVVLDRDPLQTPAEEVGSIRIEQTWLGGRLAYSAADSPVLAGV
ncbi:amidohydrolase [Arthrobacter cavernae]|uniref:Amidohydrolase family protein n=1 Tax=Arthrobacter cavernae TaxID=2817681 RepID=A0A939HHR0_9MICC|nr:amidohydrolase [Arthrobacter cavernae]MBO1268192.1 amidohydrolase family protein [Arthrobacter cavernae]